MLFQSNNTNAEENKTDNKLLTDTLITLLDPYITEGIEHYYGYNKQYGLNDVKILHISRNDDSEFSLKVKLQVNTFVEAHNPPYGKETIILGVNTEKAKIIKFIHKGDEWERKIKDFYDEVISDIKQTFQLDLNGFEKLNSDQLMFKSEKQKEYQSLTDIVTRIDNELNADIHTPYTPYKNIITPVTFLRGNQGYILYKKENGTNIVAEVSKLHDKWVVVNTNSKQGKRMKYDLLWYM